MIFVPHYWWWNKFCNNFTNFPYILFIIVLFNSILNTLFSSLFLSVLCFVLTLLSWTDFSFASDDIFFECIFFYTSSWRYVFVVQQVQNSLFHVRKLFYLFIVELMKIIGLNYPKSIHYIHEMTSDNFGWLRPLKFSFGCFLVTSDNLVYSGNQQNWI